MFGTLDCKVVKLGNWADLPPALEWAELKPGGAVVKWLPMSRHDGDWEVCFLRGPSAESFVRLATAAGQELAAAGLPDGPVLFEVLHFKEQRLAGRSSLGDAVLERDDAARWIAFVFNVFKYHRHPALSVRWVGDERPLGSGYATLDRDAFAASALAIELAGLADAPPDSGGEVRPVEVPPAGPCVVLGKQGETPRLFGRTSPS